jgi:hypothetical protein
MINSLSANEGILFFLITLWSIAWKGVSLWKAAKADSKPWFIVLLVLNTAGLLDILYIFLISKRKKEVKENA